MEPNQIAEHTHDGNQSQRVQFNDINDYSEPINVISATIATTGNTDAYFIAPRTLRLNEAYFSATAALAANDTNYITWTITNLKQNGAGSTVLLGTVTTRVTGGTAITADSKYTLALSSTVSDLGIVQGDRIRIRAASTGTLANTVTFPVYLLLFI